MDTLFNIIIIGSGPAGNTAAIYASRANLKPLLFTGSEAGGQLTKTSEVGNYPGFPNGILGPELMELMQIQAEKFGTTIIKQNVDKVDFTKQPFTIYSDNKEYHTKTVIIATGASAMWLGLENETKLRGQGVSACATCDGFFFKNKKVIVVGGGDAALEDATYLTKFASSVTLIHRRDQLRASKYMQNKALSNNKINFIWNTEVIDVIGDSKVEGVVTRNVTTDQKDTIITDGLFIAIGHRPNTEIFTNQIDLDEKGYISTADGVHTNIDGVFVAGDVHDHIFRQAITAAGDGCRAAIIAEKYLEQ